MRSGQVLKKLPELLRLPSGPIKGSGSMVQILIIDDVHEDLLLTERVIRQAGLVNPVELYRDPAGLLAFFLRTPAESEPALVFIDLMMFPRNGIEVLTMLKPYSLARESISVVLTGLGDVRQIQLAYDAGATTFLIKPIGPPDVNQFLRAFQKHFTLRNVSGGRQLGWSDETPWRVARESKRLARSRGNASRSVGSGQESGTAPDF